MKKRIANLTLTVIYLLAFELSANGTVPISPGAHKHILSIGDSCPTFSWSAADNATGYRLQVFLEAEPSLLVPMPHKNAVVDPVTHQARLAQSKPVVRQTIGGPALSWTPAAGNCLAPDRYYSWYVQGISKDGEGEWSTAHYFRVASEVTAALLQPALSTALGDSFDIDPLTRAYPVFNRRTLVGAKDSPITGFGGLGLTGDGVTSKVDNGVVPLAQESDAQFNVYYGYGAGANVKDSGSSNSMFGFFAGESAKDLLYNSFFGYYAGRSTEGNYNTFLGYGSGESNLSGSVNSFVGALSGYSNLTGKANVFVGFSAGYHNKVGKNNTFVGAYSGNDNITGSENTFTGYQAGTNNQSGDHNTFIGTFAGVFNTVGSDNTFIGRRSGTQNTSGFRNTFIGVSSGYENTTGMENVFSGYEAGRSNLSGKSNVFVGYQSGSANADANYNAFFGAQSGLSNSFGEFNSLFGYQAGYLNSSGNANSFFGYQSGRSNTTGSNNTFSGYQSGFANTVGAFNTFNGYRAGVGNTEGVANTFVGYQAGLSNKTGSRNVFLGHVAGRSATNGNDNTYLGYQSGFANVSGGRNVFLGYQAGYEETGSDKLYIENSQSQAPLIYGDFAADVVAVNGNLGIGTQVPAMSLDIRADEPAIRLQNNHARQDTWDVRVEADSGQFQINNAAARTPVKIGRQAASNLLQVGVKKRRQVNINGNLVVSGSITPDYVFSPDYALPSIDQHAKQMWQAQHLPVVQRAETDAAGQGVIDVGERSQALLEELEIAHIYIEQLHRRVEAMERRLAKLERQR